VPSCCLFANWPFVGVCVGMRRDTPTSLRTFHHASVSRKEIMWSLASAGKACYIFPGPAFCNAVPGWHGFWNAISKAQYNPTFPLLDMKYLSCLFFGTVLYSVDVLMLYSCFNFRPVSKTVRFNVVKVIPAGSKSGAVKKAFTAA
jgi:hypothetical protein